MFIQSYCCTKCLSKVVVTCGYIFWLFSKIEILKFVGNLNLLYNRAKKSIENLYPVKNSSSRELFCIVFNIHDIVTFTFLMVYWGKSQFEICYETRFWTLNLSLRFSLYLLADKGSSRINGDMCTGWGWVGCVCGG